MSLADALEARVRAILGAVWSFRVGRVVPSTDDVALAGGSVELDATILYSDLAESSTLVNESDRRVAAKVIKSFLASACQVIRARRGAVVSFDGDRVMGVFVGEKKNSSAAMAALQINYVVKRILAPKLEAQFASLKRTGFEFVHCTGVDTGKCIAVRAGIRGNNDLVFVGTPANLAASLSAIRDGFPSYITEDVFTKLNEEAKFGGTPRELMWERATWKWKGQDVVLYRSKWTWKPP